MNHRLKYKFTCFDSCYEWKLNKTLVSTDFVGTWIVGDTVVLRCSW